MKEKVNGVIWVPGPEFLAKELDFIKKEIEEIGGEQLRKLVETAVSYFPNAYNPYSKYNVGAALLTTDGQFFGSCNSEGVNYSTTNHAEGSAIARANSEGLANKNRKYIKALAVVHNGDSGPCGECLQRIVEHADNCLIITATPDGKINKITSLNAIFPYNFNPSHLGK